MVGPQTPGLLQLASDTRIGNCRGQAEIEIHVRQTAAGQGYEYRHPVTGGERAESGNVRRHKCAEIDDAVTVLQADIRLVAFEQARQALQGPVPLHIPVEMVQRVRGCRQSAQKINPLTRPVQCDALANAHNARGSRKPLLKSGDESALAAAVNPQDADQKRHEKESPVKIPAPTGYIRRKSIFTTEPATITENIFIPVGLSVIDYPAAAARPLP